LADDLAGFKSWIEIRAREVGAAADDAVRRAALDLTRRLVSYTPVDTGRARAGWRISTAGPPTGTEAVSLPVQTEGGLIRRAFPVRQPGRLRSLGTGYPGRPRGAIRGVFRPTAPTGSVSMGLGHVSLVRTGGARPPRLPSPRVAGMVFGPAGAASSAEAGNIMAMLQTDIASYRSGEAGLYVYNNVPYVVFLNQGHSRQASANFIERAILETSWEGVRIFER
jgi:hypothetical protein